MRTVCSSPVRRASADVVSVVAKHAVPAGEWPELLPFLHQCSQSALEDHREVSGVLCSCRMKDIMNGVVGFEVDSMSSASRACMCYIKIARIELTIEFHTRRHCSNDLYALTEIILCSKTSMKA